MKSASKKAILLASVTSLLVAPSLHAATRTWTGASDSAWGTSTNWSSSTVPTASDIAQWDTPSTTNLAIALGANRSVLGLKVLSPSGAVSLSGSTLTVGTDGIDMSAATQDLTISSSLTLGAGNQIWNVVSSRTLTLNTGTFTRANSATLNIQGSGTVAASMAGLANNVNTGIIGAWATVGTGANTRYATVSGGNIVAYTTAPANIYDTTLPAAPADANGNFQFIGSTNLSPGTNRSFNTILYTGSGLTWTQGATSGSTVNGILNAGTGTFTFTGGGNLSIGGSGGSSELVLHAANANINILTQITGASKGVTVVGPNTVILGGANTYTGATTVNSGTLQFAKAQAFYGNVIDATNAAKLTVNSGATAAFNIGATTGEFTEGNISTLLAASNGTVGFKSGSNLGLDTTNANGGTYTYGTAIVDPNGNAIGLTKLGSNTLTLNQANTYSGGTTVTAGTLSFANGALGTTGNISMNGGALQWASSNTQDLSSRIVMNAGKTATFDTNGNNVTFASAIGNSTNGSLTKTGAGTLTLSNANTYTGGTSVNGGLLVLDYTTQNNNKIASGAALSFGGGSLAITANAVADTVQTVANTALNAGSATITVNKNGANNATLNLGAITRTTGATMNVVYGGTGSGTAIATAIGTPLTNDIIGPWATVGTGANTRYATLDGSNNLVGYTGATAATNLPPSGGTGVENYEVTGTTNQTPGVARNYNTVRYASAGITWQTQSGISLTLNGVLNAGTGAFTISSVNQTNSGVAIGGSNELVLNAANANINISARISGAAKGVTVVGPNTVTLGGTNTYTGATTVNGGTLNVTGSLSGAVTVNNGATFAGTGSVNTNNQAFTVASGAKLDPSSAAFAVNTGTANLDISGAVGGANSGALVFNLDSIANSDKITLTLSGSGALAIGSGALDLADFAFTTSGGFAGGTYTLIDTNTVINGTLGTNLTGTIGGLGATLSLSGDSTDLILTVVPEPGSAVALFGGLGMLLGMRRRSRAV